MARSKPPRRGAPRKKGGASKREGGGRARAGGARRASGRQPQARRSRFPVWIALVLGAVVFGVGGLAFQFGSNGTRQRLAANERSAAGALKTIATAQALFREADSEGDGVMDFAGELSELGAAGLIDAALASGSKQGYVFALKSGAGEGAAFSWMATADPAIPGETGEHHLAIDRGGEVFANGLGHPFEIPTDCRVPGSAKPIPFSVMSRPR